MKNKKNNKRYKAKIKFKVAIKFINEQFKIFAKNSDYIEIGKLWKDRISVEFDIRLFKERIISLESFFLSTRNTVFNINNAIRVNGERLVYYPYKFSGNFKEIKKQIDEFADEHPHIPVIVTHEREDGEVHLHTIESLEGEINDFIMEELGLEIAKGHI